MTFILQDKEGMRNHVIWTFLKLGKEANFRSQGNPFYYENGKHEGFLECWVEVGKTGCLHFS